MQQKCSQCGAEIKTQIFKNTGVCGIDCKKKRDGDPPKKVY